MLAVQVGQVAADGSGRAAAVAQELAPVRVAQLHRILLEGGDEVAAARGRDAGFRQTDAQARRLLEARPVGGGIGERRLEGGEARDLVLGRQRRVVGDVVDGAREGVVRSEEHTSELQSLMRISYAVFCLKKKNTNRDDNRVTK